VRVKTEEKRRAILEAAKDVFLERGYGAASMSEVAARVGGSKQTLYSYFSSKEELFVAMMLEKGAVQIDPLFDSVHENPNLPAALREFAIQFLRFTTSEEILAFRRIIYAEGAKSNLGKLFFENGPKRGWMRMAQEFARAMDEGRMRRADPWQAVMHLNGLCEAGPFQRLAEGAVAAVSDEELVKTVDSAVDVFVRAYDLVEPRN
jgi:AcrR family transcriptional regulator